ncbi:threonine/serine exporter family protein [Eubacterium sp. AB3007]|uniref:threonine/serine exporter family protein n=1 Tax=Eubacterium sp. AB3007 TaxID=1392487 RepID=UPI000690809B|nr:threonine/serine exporter family protein [Eubacterium sp. AB3007]
MNEIQVLIQLTAAFFGSVGFAIILRIRGKQIAYSGVGGLMTWGIYLIAFQVADSYFMGNFVASIFIAFYAEVCARRNKAPATIFLIASAVPLIPGRNLYNMMFGLVSQNSAMAWENGVTALVIALAIALGFVVVTVLNKYVSRMKRFAKDVL